MPKVLTGEELRVRRNAEVAAAKSAGHRPFCNPMADDKYHCSCGWEGPPFWDDGEAAYAAWLQHIEEKGIEIYYPE